MNKPIDAVKSLHNSPLPSIAGRMIYGIDRSVVHDAMLNRWSLSNTAGLLRFYYIRKWNARYLLSQVTDGYITHNGRKYVAYPFQCTWDDIRNCKQVMLSFRVAEKEYQLAPVVLISTQASENFAGETN